MKRKSIMLIIGAMCFGAFLFGAITSTIISNAQNESSIPAPSFTPPIFSFQKDLKLGDNNQDVRQLQIVLNDDTSTRISDSGVGSKGQESTYFGQLTKNAVMRFQLKNNISGTGFVGPMTRAKLNQVTSNIATTPALVSTTTGLVSTGTASGTSRFSGPLPLSKELLPRLYTAQPRQIKKGEAFTLVGAGFQVENTVHIGSNVFPHVFPQDGNNITFTIPTTSTIPNGTYDVWIENSKGSSQVPGRPIKLLITDTPQPAPVIVSVSPSSVSGIENVTVTGAGFSSIGNDIVSGFGTIKNLSSNGTQITFPPRSLLSADVIKRIGAGKTMKVDFYVVNINGASSVFGSVNLKI